MSLTVLPFVLPCAGRWLGSTKFARPGVVQIGLVTSDVLPPSAASLPGAATPDASRIRSLRSHFRCVAPDYPGFGLSTAARGPRLLPADHAAVVSRFVEALDLDGFAVMGQDWADRSGCTTQPATSTAFGG